MSKLLLSCDEYIYKFEGRFYTESQQWLEFYQRYLRVFDEIRLALRCETVTSLKTGWVPMDLEPRIEIIPLPIFHGPLQYAKVYFKTGLIIRSVVDDCDAAIVRIPSTVAMRICNQVIKRGIPYACEVVYDAEDGWRGSKGLECFLWKRIDKQMRLQCYKANGVACVTEHYLQRNYYPKTQNSFVSHYSSISLKHSFYGSSRSYPSHKVFVIAHTSYIIQFDGSKGANQIIEALHLLKRRGIFVKVRFAGHDRNGNSLKLKALAKKLDVEDNIEFVGFLSRESMDVFLSESDLFVMPTKAEGLPRVIIEAMAKGLPCITTPVSGNPELINSHFLVDYYDINTLADRIEELINNQELYEKTSEENFSRSKQYEDSILQARRDSFYKQLLDCVIKK